MVILTTRTRRSSLAAVCVAGVAGLAPAGAEDFWQTLE